MASIIWPAVCDAVTLQPKGKLTFSEEMHLLHLLATCFSTGIEEFMQLTYKLSIVARWSMRSPSYNYANNIMLQYITKIFPMITNMQYINGCCGRDPSWLLVCWQQLTHWAEAINQDFLESCLCLKGLAVYIIACFNKQVYLTLKIT